MLVDLFKTDTSTLTEDRTLIADFGQPEQEKSAACVGEAKSPLTATGIVAVTGKDALAFIQTQFTSDCAALTPASAQLSAWCDPKGRVLYSFIIFTAMGESRILMPRCDIPAFMKRLQMYVMRADVVVADRSEESAVLGLSIPASEPRAGTSYTLPSTRFGTATSANGVTVIHVDSAQNRYVVCGPREHVTALWRASPLAAVGDDAWGLLDVLAGFPRIAEQTRGKYIPQNLNLDMLGAVSFSKGCYPGQEIVARMKYRARSVTRMLIGATDGPPPARGTAVVADPAASASPSGHVFEARQSVEGRSVALICLNPGDLKEWPATVVDETGATYAITRPAYWIDADSRE